MSYLSSLPSKLYAPSSSRFRRTSRPSLERRSPSPPELTHDHGNDTHWNYKDTYAAPSILARAASYADTAAIKLSTGHSNYKDQQQRRRSDEQSGTAKPTETATEILQQIPLEALERIAESEVTPAASLLDNPRRYMPPMPYARIHGYRPALDCGIDPPWMSNMTTVGGRKMERYDPGLPKLMNSSL
jgi:hypothetical protein